MPQNKSTLPNELLCAFAIGHRGVYTSVNQAEIDKVLANCTTKIFIASTEKGAADYTGFGLSQDELLGSNPCHGPR